MDVFEFNAEMARYRAQLRRDMSFMLFMLLVAIAMVWYVYSSPALRWGSLSLLLLLLIPYTWYQNSIKDLRARDRREREDARFDKLRTAIYKDSAALVKQGPKPTTMSAARVVELSKRVQAPHVRGDDRPSRSSSQQDDNTMLNTVLLMAATDDTPTRSTYTPSSSYCSSSSSSYSSSSYDSSSSSSDSGSSSSSCD